MKNIFTTILFVAILNNLSNAQVIKFAQTNSVKFIKPGTVSDTLLNPFAGGLNAPIFSNTDWNKDGKKDLFVFDKETNRVIAFEFKDGKMHHAPKYEAGFNMWLQGWAFLTDYNADGFDDLLTASFSHNQITALPNAGGGYTQLFVNKPTPRGNRVFKQFNNLLFDTGAYYPPPTDLTTPKLEIPSASGSVIGIADIDGDGDDDIISNQNVYTTIMFYENLRKNKWNIVYPNDSVKYIYRDACWGIINYNFYNHSFHLGVNRNAISECEFNLWPRKKHIDQSMCFIDLNGDGVKDMVFGDSEFKTLISLTNGRLQHSHQVDSIVSQDTLFLSDNGITRKSFIGFPAAYYVDIDGDNKNELLISTAKTDATKTANNIWTYNADRPNNNLVFTQRTGTDFLYADMIDVGRRSSPAIVDIDGDGDKDLVVATSGSYEQAGNNSDRLFLYLNVGSETNAVFKFSDSNFANLANPHHTAYFQANPTFGDLNGDGKPDLMVGEGNGNIAYFENTTTGNVLTFNLVNRNAFGIVAGTHAAPQLFDLDKDGLLDIVCGMRDGFIRFYKNTGTSTVPTFSAAPTIDSLGKINAKEIWSTVGKGDLLDVQGYATPNIADFNNDGVLDMVLGCNSGRVYVYTNVVAHKDSTFKLLNNAFIDFGTDDNVGYNKRFGGRTTVASALIDGDNAIDVMLGNISGGLIFLSGNPIIGINETDFNDPKALTVFPNPANNLINITYNRNVNGMVNYQLIDVLGRVVGNGNFDANETNPVISLDTIGNGLYFVHFKTKDWASTQRVLVQKQ